MFEALADAVSGDNLISMNHLQKFCLNELLLDRLVLLCSSTILTNTNVHNDYYILSKATHLEASALIFPESVQKV